jgi:hypothetical protein
VRETKFHTHTKQKVKFLEAAGEETGKQKALNQMVAGIPQI